MIVFEDLPDSHEQPSCYCWRCLWPRSLPMWPDMTHIQTHTCNGKWVEIVMVVWDYTNTYTRSTCTTLTFSDVLMVKSCSKSQHLLIAIMLIDIKSNPIQSSSKEYLIDIKSVNQKEKLDTSEHYSLD